MKIEEMKEMKRALGYTNEDLSKLSGVPLGTVQKIFGGITKAPRRETILALERVLKGKSASQSGVASYSKPDYGTSAVNETVLRYRAELPEGAPNKKQGEYTLDDYYALPDDQRAELIDGVLFNMTSPSTIHQTIGLQVAHQFLQCMDEHPECEVFISPMDVQLDMDNRTMVEPDVIVICDMSKVIKRCLYGAPDFVLEVISPSTRRKDLVIKLNKYWQAGCREYWIVDPEDESVVVYDFDHEQMALRYSFDDSVPIGISDGSCFIDFKPIKKRLNRLGIDE